MTGKSRVAWREGMFLRPQHFQQQDRHADAALNARISAVGPYRWGLTELVIDEDLATLGKFAVTRCVGVMPDGTAFAIPDQLPPPPPIDVPMDARDAVVSLTLPAQQVGAVEFREADGASLDTRFLTDEVEVTDAYSSDRTSEPIEVGRPNLSFGITRDQTYGRVCLGLARIRELQSKRLQLSEFF
jgi:type VI secretion system protein ImpJ